MDPRASQDLRSPSPIMAPDTDLIMLVALFFPSFVMYISGAKF